MAIDDVLAEQMREGLAHLNNLKEVRMVDGLYFMHHGHMLCAIHKDRALSRW